MQSNHLRQVSAAAAKLGFKAVLLVKDMVPERTSSSHPHQITYSQLGNVQLSQLMSATREETSTPNLAEILGKKDVYWIPPGASLHPLGGLGYARWAFEIEAQEREMGVFFDSIVVALKGGSTLGGMVAGFVLAAEKLRQEQGESKRRRRLIGVQAGPMETEKMQELVLEIAQDTFEKIGGSSSKITKTDFELDDRWHGGSYGRLDNRTRENIKLAATKEALITDPVYSGKALSGVCEMVRAHELQGNVLFVHTGGVLSVNAYPDLK